MMRVREAELPRLLVAFTMDSLGSETQAGGGLFIGVRLFRRQIRRLRTVNSDQVDWLRHDISMIEKLVECATK